MTKMSITMFQMFQMNKPKSDMVKNGSICVVQYDGLRERSRVKIYVLFFNFLYMDTRVYNLGIFIRQRQRIQVLLDYYVITILTIIPRRKNIESSVIGFFENEPLFLQAFGDQQVND